MVPGGVPFPASARRYGSLSGWVHLPPSSDVDVSHGCKTTTSTSRRRYGGQRLVRRALSCCGAMQLAQRDRKCPSVEAER